MVRLERGVGGEEGASPIMAGEAALMEPLIAKCVFWRWKEFVESLMYRRLPSLSLQSPPLSRDDVIPRGGLSRGLHLFLFFSPCTGRRLWILASIVYRSPENNDHQSSIIISYKSPARVLYVHGMTSPTL